MRFYKKKSLYKVKFITCKLDVGFPFFSNNVNLREKFQRSMCIWIMNNSCKMMNIQENNTNKQMINGFFLMVSYVCLGM